MLLPVLPASNILAAVCPLEDPVTLPFVVLELTLVMLSILPLKGSISVHLVFLPLPLVLLAIRPEIVSEPADLVGLEFSVIVAPISKGELASSVLLTITVLAFVLGTVWPRFHSPALLLVVYPVTIVVSTVSM
jgi:hypothetical protein